LAALDPSNVSFFPQLEVREKKKDAVFVNAPSLVLEPFIAIVGMSKHKYKCLRERCHSQPLHTKVSPTPSSNCFASKPLA
jgi:hypothetical protein